MHPALSLRNRGFTLVELLVVISIVAILSVVGVVIYTGVQKSARDSVRKSDIEAISKALEVKYNNTGKYGDLDPTKPENTSLFSSGVFPKDSARNKDYTIIKNTASGGFNICASLEANQFDSCAGTSEGKCFCKSSTQAEPPASAGGSGVVVVTNPGTSGIVGACSDSLKTNLIGYWKMDDTNWSGTPGGNGIGYNGVATVEGKIGKAGSFDGSNDYVVVPNYSAPIGLAEITIGAWINPATINPGGPYGEGRIVNWSGNNILFQILSGGILNVYINGGGNFRTGAVLALNKWQHVAFTWKTSGAIIVYVNGTVAATGTLVTTAINGSAADLRFGTYTGDATISLFNGLIDDIRIYGRTLDPSEVALLYNNGLGCIAP